MHYREISYCKKKPNEFNTVRKSVNMNFLKILWNESVGDHLASQYFFDCITQRSLKIQKPINTNN